MKPVGKYRIYKISPYTGEMTLIRSLTVDEAMAWKPEWFSKWGDECKHRTVYTSWPVAEGQAVKFSRTLLER